VNKHDQVVLVVTGANDLIYAYVKDSVTLVVEKPPDALANFLKGTVEAPAATESAAAAAGTGDRADVCTDAGKRIETPDRTPGIEPVLRWGVCLYERGLRVRDLLTASDDGIVGGDNVPDNELDSVLRSKAATIDGPGLGGGKVTLRESWEQYKLQVERLTKNSPGTTGEVDLLKAHRTLLDLIFPDALKDGNDTAGEVDQLKAQRTLLDLIFPDALTVLDRLATGTVRDLTLRWSFDDATGKVLRLRITNKLGDAYQPRRPLEADPGANVATVRIKAGFFEASAGLSWTPLGDQYTYTVAQDSDATIFTPKKRDAFLPVPSTLFTVRPFRRAWMLGLSAMLGLHVGDGTSTISEAIDYGAMLTGGYEWLRLSGGVVWRRELDADRLPGGADPANGPIVTTDSTLRSLDAVGYRRKPYLGFVVSCVIP
jgi:hypothetical protein